MLFALFAAQVTTFTPSARARWLSTRLSPFPWLVLCMRLALLGLLFGCAPGHAATVAGGNLHSLQIRNGTIYASGDNGFGQLGDGTQTQRNSAVSITLPGGIAATAVAAGGGHSLVIGSNGKLYAWGNDASGQIGTGASSYSAYLNPTLVQSLPASITVSAVAGGGDHSLAIGSDGKLYAWGSNAAGQLGDNSALTRRDTAGIVSLPAGVGATAVAAGVNHSLAIGSNGKLYAWGSNSAGQLGDGTQTQRNAPVIVSLPTGVSPIAVAAGGDHSQAIGSDGKLYAWGINTVGQLGDGTTTQRLTPVVVSLPAGVTPVAIATGYSHSMATGSDGKLYAWGYGGNGQVGDGAATPTHTVPVPVVLPVGVSPSANIAAGANHSLALGSDQRLYAWGYDASGQLGDNATTQRLLPLAVSAPISPAQVNTLAAGDYHTLQIRNGKLYAWGSNDHGQLGDGTTTNRATPVVVTLAAGVAPVSVAAGTDHSLAIGSDGKLYAWGGNSFGQLGDGSTTPRNTPVAVHLPAGVTPTAVATGGFFSLAIGSDGELYGWGYNGYGQLGNGSTTPRNTPVAVNLPAGITPAAVSAGSAHSLAIGSDGKLYAWGDNRSGELGDGSTTQRNAPMAVNLPAGVTPTAVSAGGAHSLTIGTDGKLYAWGANNSGQLGDGSTTFQRATPGLVSLPAGVVPVRVAGGYFHSLLLGSDGQLYAWGYNYYGQLGDGTTTLHSTPEVITLPNGSQPAWVAAGSEHSLALSTDGKLYAWGYNPTGQLGDGGTNSRATPAAVGLPITQPQAHQFAAGSAHVLQIRAGALYTWGSNTAGQLGDGSFSNRSTPGTVALPTGFIPTFVAAGAGHSMVIGASGTLYTWGLNDSGQLGDGTNVTRSAPVAITLGTGVSAVAVAGGTSHSLAIGSDGKLYAWGANTFGQLGDGTTNSRANPAVVNLPTGITPTAIAAGDSHSLAIGSDGKLYAWGYNNNGQLGDGSTTNRMNPVAVNLPAGVAATSLAAGLIHSLAIASNGQLYAWGSNYFGQLGSSGADSSSPIVVSLPSGASATSVAAGASHSLATDANGRLYAWGDNSSGQLGNGTSNPITPHGARVIVNLPSGVTPKLLAAGAAFSATLGSDSLLYVWGDNVSGQLGGALTTVGQPGAVTAYPAPASDSFTNRQLITSASGQTTGNNLNATRETGEPLHYGSSGGKSVWWKWVAPRSGTLTVSTVGSDFDTVLAVYTGSAVSTLTQLASNDDSDDVPTSQVSLSVQAGAEYQIAVDGYGSGANARSGSIVLNWSLASQQQAQTITFPTIPSQTLGTAPINISATASSGLAVAFESLSISVCTVSGNTVALLAAGTCTVAAHQAGNAQYAAAPDVVQGFTVAAGGGGIGDNSDSSDAPLPGWALLMLSGLLAGSLRLRQVKQR